MCFQLELQKTCQQGNRLANKKRKYRIMATYLINNATLFNHHQHPYEPPRTVVLNLVPYGVLCSSAVMGLTNTESFDMSEMIVFP